MIRRPPRSTRTDTPFPTRRSSDLLRFLQVLRAMNREVGRRQDRGGGDRCQRDDEDRGNQGNAVLSALHGVGSAGGGAVRSEEHTSELQSLMRISYAVFCLKKKKNI